MLVLTRKRHQTVQIGPDIFVQVLGIRGDSVQLGFEAPTSVAIDRAEVIDAHPEVAAKHQGVDIGDIEQAVTSYNSTEMAT